MNIHESHHVNANGWSDCPLPGSIGRVYEETHCSLCGLGTDDERIEAKCFEEPLGDPYGKPE